MTCLNGLKLFCAVFVLFCEYSKNRVPIKLSTSSKSGLFNDTKATKKLLIVLYLGQDVSLLRVYSHHDVTVVTCFCLCFFSLRVYKITET